MYVDPFWVGFLLGGLSMLALLIMFSVMYGKRRG